MINIKNKIFVQSLIQDIFEHDIPVKVLSNGDYKIEGFYKSDAIILKPDCYGTMWAHSRYEETCQIFDFKDLVELNYEWWKRSKDRADTWQTPDPLWQKWLIEFGFVKVTTITKEIWE
jgi:hypothetical protein